MAEAFAYESWVGSETVIGTDQLGSSWDQVQLGEVFLPGVCTVEDFEIGRDIDVQKRRKKEKARLRDNGISPCSFKIICEIRASQWADWLKVRPHLQPKEGGVRAPLTITHPLPNSHDVRDIYVHKIHVGRPSARGGMKITITVGEWFEEEKDSNGASASANKKPKYSPPDWFGDDKALAKKLQERANFPSEDPAELERRLLGE
jgi:hypothetical protein